MIHLPGCGFDIPGDDPNYQRWCRGCIEIRERNRIIFAELQCQKCGNTTWVRVDQLTENMYVCCSPCWGPRVPTGRGYDRMANGSEAKQGSRYFKRIGRERLPQQKLWKI